MQYSIFFVIHLCRYKYNVSIWNKHTINFLKIISIVFHFCRLNATGKDQRIV